MVTLVNTNTRQILSSDINQINNNYIIHFMYIIIPKIVYKKKLVIKINLK